MFSSFLGTHSDDAVELDVVRDDLIDPEWIEDKIRLGNGPIKSMDPKELLFFQVNRSQGSLPIYFILLHRLRPNCYLRKHPNLFN